MINSHHFCFSGHFPRKTGSKSVFFVHLFWNRPSGNKWHIFFARQIEWGLRVTFAVLDLCHTGTHNSGNILCSNYSVFAHKLESAHGLWFKLYCQRSRTSQSHRWAGGRTDDKNIPCYHSIELYKPKVTRGPCIPSNQDPIESQTQ